MIVVEMLFIFSFRRKAKLFNSDFTYMVNHYSDKTSVRLLLKLRIIRFLCLMKDIDGIFVQARA